MSAKVTKLDVDPRQNPDVRKFMNSGRTRNGDDDVRDALEGTAVSSPAAPEPSAAAPASESGAVAPTPPSAHVTPTAHAPASELPAPPTDGTSSAVRPARPRKPRVYPWQEPSLRDDVLVSRTYRLPERLVLKFEFAARRRGVSLTALLTEALGDKVAEVFDEEDLPNN
jgi:hypothetical protein